MQINFGIWLLGWWEVEDEIGLDGEDGIGLEPRVVTWENLSDNLLVAVGGDHQMDVCWAHGMAVQGSEKLVGRTIGWQAVCSRLEAVESI